MSPKSKIYNPKWQYPPTPFLSFTPKIEYFITACGTSESADVAIDVRFHLRQNTGGAL